MIAKPPGEEQNTLERCKALARPAGPAQIDRLGVMTCAAPGLLQRALAGWIDYLRRLGRDVPIIVIDDSPTERQGDEQAAVADAIRAKTGHPVNFFGPAQRKHLVTRAAAHCSVDANTIAFAIAGCAAPRTAIGGSRNLLALLAQDRCVMSADDDVRPLFEAPPPHDIKLWITSEDVPTRTQFFESAADLEAGVRLADNHDALALHEQFLGRDIGTIVKQIDGRTSLHGAGPHLTSLLQTQPMRVAATALGLAGDSASDCAAFFSLLATGDSERNFHARPQTMSPSREILRRTEFPVFCQGVYLMTYCYAFDNRLPLPPAFPAGRGEDQVWQKLLHLALPETLVGHLPLAVYHRPAGYRTYSDDDYVDPCATFPGNAFLLGALNITPAAPADADAGARLAIAGRHLEELAASEKNFRHLVHAAWQAYVDYHRRLADQALASRPNHPGWWREALHRARAILVQRREQMPPLEYGAHTGDAAIRAMRPDVARFGRILQAWPEMRAAFRGLDFADQ